MELQQEDLLAQHVGHVSEFELLTSATHADSSVPPQLLPVRQVEVSILSRRDSQSGTGNEALKCSNATNHGSDGWDP